MDILRGLFVARARQCLGRELDRAVFAGDRAVTSVQPETLFWSKIVTLIRYPGTVYSRKRP
jgi:hypothetical protein